MSEERVSIRTADMGAGLTLEGVLYLPGAPERQFPGVVVCHPHPRYGGSMDNNVVYALCDALAELHIATLRFNFRGVGRSEGQYGGGSEEVFDAIAAVSFLEANPSIEPGHIGLAGYSFGARVSVQVAEKDPRVRALAAVSLPMRDLGPQGVLTSFTHPKLFIVGEEDDVVNPEAIARFIESLPEPKEFQAVPGADHFWLGFEGAVGPTVAQFFSRAFSSV